jgi:Bacteriorhodopsin
MLQELPTLSAGQYNLVFNMFSFTIATMFASFVFFVMARNNLAPKYRISMMISALVVFIAGYHYFRITQSWQAAFDLQNGMYVYSGEPFNDAYRYVDWLLTVPLLTVELVLVMGLPKGKSGPLAAKLGIGAALMIATGYPGEVSTSTSTRVIWGVISSVFMFYVLYLLWSELGDALQRQSDRVATLLGNARLLLLATWGFYPIVYCFPYFGWTGSSAVAGVQVGYTIADVLAKAGYGVLIYNIAKAKSEEEGFDVSEMVEPATVTT